MPIQSLTDQLRLLEIQYENWTVIDHLCQRSIAENLLAVAKGLEKERDELRDLRADESASIRAALEAAAANADEANALRAENERQRHALEWIKRLEVPNANEARLFTILAMKTKADKALSK